MKTKYLLFALIALLAACTADDNANSPREALLQIETYLPATRAIVEKTAFADGDTIILFVEDTNGSTIAQNVMAKRVGTQWVLTEKVKITTEAANVYALTQDNSCHYEGSPVWLEYKTSAYSPQHELLYGTSVAPVSFDNAVARLQFRYALAKLTFRFSREGLSTESNCIVHDIELSGHDGDKMVTNFGIVDRYGNIEPEFDSSSAVTSLYSFLDNTILPTDGYYDADLLVIPTTATGNAMLRVNYTVGYDFQNATLVLNNVKWERNTHYIYNIEIADDGSLQLGSITIEPRGVEEQEPTILASEQAGGAAGNLTVGGSVATAVDLGLSVLWASHDLGVDRETDYKNFNWGDPTGTAPSNSAPPMTPDICGTHYDIATAQWGGYWRLPSAAEMQELIDNCKMTIVTRNNVVGALFTSKVPGYTSRSIFFPTDQTYKNHREGQILSGTRENRKGFYVRYLWITNENTASPTTLTLVSTMGYSKEPYYAVQGQVRPVLEKR